LSIGTRDLDLLYRVGPVGNRGTGEYFDRLAGIESPLELRACCDLADHPELERYVGDIGGAKCIAIHASAIKRRKIYIGANVFGKNATMGLFKRDGLGTEWLDVIEHDTERFIDGDHKSRRGVENDPA
jgi:hypothetical protein